MQMLKTQEAVKCCDLCLYLVVGFSGQVCTKNYVAGLGGLKESWSGPYTA